MNFVGIDTGRKNTKVAGERVLQFPSLVGSARELRLENGLDYDVTINGKLYFVGWLAEESYDRREMASKSKIHEETKVLLLTALALASWPGEQNFITTGLPVEQHAPETKLLLNNLVRGKHRIAINDQEITLEVGNVQIVPEGAGAWWDAVLNDQGHIVDQLLLRQPVTRILDLGSRTINYLTLLQGRYLDRASGTLNYGCMELERSDNDPELFARRIIADLTKRWPDLSKSDLVFITGGGSLLMREALTKEFPTTITAAEPVTANARGYRKLGMVYAQKSKSSVL